MKLSLTSAVTITVYWVLL